MLQAIYTTLMQTPWWVYLLLAYLLKVGIKASKPGVVSLKKMMVLPLVFTAMSIHSLYVSFGLETSAISMWLVSIVAGSVAGWLLVCRHNITVDKQHHLIGLPGSWVTMGLVVVIFASKYYFGYEMAADPQLLQQTSFEVALLLVSGACTGLFIGRVAYYLRAFMIKPSVDLSAELSQA